MSITAAFLALVTAGALQDTTLRLEREVQAAVLDSLFIRDTTQRVVIGDSTISGGTHFVDEDRRNALKWLGPLPTGLQAEFERVRRVRRVIDSLPLKVDVVPFDAAQRAQLLVVAARNPTAYWQEFYRRFPRSPGLVELSRPAFSRDGTMALILVEYGCGGLCGGTLYVLLERRAKRWHVVKVAQPRIA